MTQLLGKCRTGASDESRRKLPPSLEQGLFSSSRTPSNDCSARGIAVDRAGVERFGD
jgi:hypothetical protein